MDKIFRFSRHIINGRKLYSKFTKPVAISFPSLASTPKYVINFFKKPVNLIGLAITLKQIPITICPLDGESLRHGGRPFWDEDRQILYFIDVDTCAVYKYCYNGNRTTRACVGKNSNPCYMKVTSKYTILNVVLGSEPLGFMIPVEGEDNRFIAGLGRKLVFITWDGRCKNVQKIEYITEVDWEEGMTSNRFNAGKVDPYGRLWAGITHTTLLYI